jgi:hypothetical protein
MKLFKPKPYAYDAVIPLYDCPWGVVGVKVVQHNGYDSAHESWQEHIRHHREYLLFCLRHREWKQVRSKIKKLIKLRFTEPREP